MKQRKDKAMDYPKNYDFETVNNWVHDTERYYEEFQCALLGFSTEFEKLRGLLLWSLYHHQGASSKVGQPIRVALGMGEFDPLSPEQIQQMNKVVSALMTPNALGQEPCADVCARSPAPECYATGTGNGK